MWGYLHITDGNAKRNSHFGKHSGSFGGFYLKYSYYPGIMLLDIYPNDLKNLRTYQNLFMNIYFIFILKCSKMEATKISLKK